MKQRQPYPIVSNLLVSRISHARLWILSLSTLEVEPRWVAFCPHVLLRQRFKGSPEARSLPLVRMLLRINVDKAA